MVDKHELSNTIFKSLPDWIAILFGDPIGKIAGFSSVLIKGFEYHQEIHKDFWDSVVTGYEALELIDDQLKSAQFIQYTREILLKVAYETREEKRKYFFNAAMNFIEKNEKFTFDKKMYFLNLLDIMSVEELILLLYYYDQIEENPYENNQKMQLTLDLQLANHGFLTRDFENIEDALRELSGKPNTVGIPEKRDYKIDERYRHNDLGLEFTEFICRGKLKKRKEISLPDF
ncbi:MAG: hypothetical protein V1859_02265 [archaeon]